MYFIGIPYNIMLGDTKMFAALVKVQLWRNKRDFSQSRIHHLLSEIQHNKVSILKLID